MIECVIVLALLTLLVATDPKSSDLALLDGWTLN
jgi:hypothetical protein